MSVSIPFLSMVISNSTGQNHDSKIELLWNFMSSINLTKIKDYFDISIISIIFYQSTIKDFLYCSFVVIFKIWNAISKFESYNSIFESYNSKFESYNIALKSLLYMQMHVHCGMGLHMCYCRCCILRLEECVQSSRTKVTGDFEPLNLGNKS